MLYPVLSSVVMESIPEKNYIWGKSQKIWRISHAEFKQGNTWDGENSMFKDPEVGWTPKFWRNGIAAAE